MRLIIFAVILCLIGYGAWHTWSTGHGLFSTFGAPAVENFIHNPHLTEKMTGQKIDTPSAAETVAAAVPAASNAVAAPVPASATAAASPPPVVPVEEPVSAFYSFKFREPPAALDLEVGKSGSVHVLVDRATRVVSCSGPRDDVSAVLGFCGMIDQVGGSCAVQTWAVYVDKSAQKGFDLVAALRAVTSTETAGTFGSGGFTLNLSAGDVGVALSAIADGSSVEVVQRPHVRLTHLIPAKIESTQEVPIPVSTLSNGFSQSSVQYRKVGLQLEVTPYFLSNDLVRLSVNQTNGIIGDNVEIQGSSIPIIQSQTVQATTDLTIGQTVILGGVATQRVRTVRGLLRNTREITEGALYVILSTSHDIPKALPVEQFAIEAPGFAPDVPMSVPMESPADWIDGQLLPSKDWMKDEKEFVRSRGRK